MKRSVHDEQILVTVHTPPLIRHRRLRIAAHPARTGLMLPSAQYQTRLRPPTLFTTTRAHPLLATLAHELRRFNRSAMRRAAKTRHRNPPLVAHRSINRDTPLRIRNVLHWTTHVHHARVVLAHEALILDAPARELHARCTCVVQCRTFRIL